MTTGAPPPPAGLAAAPILGGALGLFLGVFTLTRLAQPAASAEESALRLFAAFFILFGLWFCADAARGIAAAARQQPHRPAVLPPLAGGLVVALIAAPFNVSWTAPWTLFQALVLGLDITALALILVAVQRAWDRRHATVRPARAALSPAAAATRRLRLGFVAVLFGSLGLLVAWVGGRQALADWRLWSALQRVDGVVTRQVMFNFRGRDGLPSANAAAIIRYQVGGKSYETTQRIDPAVAPKYGKGTSVPLLYDPANPGRGRLINPYETFLIGGVLLMLATIFLGVAGMAASRAGAAARLAAAGP